MEADLNFEQQSAVYCNNETVMVPAGPGSGKSHTLVERVAHSVQLGAGADRIVVLTFTNNGARVFIERLAKRGIRVGFAGTVHGYGMRILQEFGTLLGYRPGGTISIVTEQASKQLLNQVREELYSKISDKELKARETPPAKLIWNEYEFRLKRANMVDYDGILRDALALLKKDSVKLLSEVSELLVDERQDSAEIETEIFWAIPAHRRFFVGDVDQSIYAFRGARPDLFVTEAGKHGFIALETNYRSDKAICDAANDLIGHNTNRIGKTINPVSKDDGLVTLRAFPHDGDEIYGVWSLIKEESVRVPFSQMAVLCRTNAIAEKFRETLRGLGVPVNGERSRKVPDDWQFVISLVSLMVDPANDFHAEALLRLRGVADGKITELKTKAASESKYLSTVSGLPNSRPVGISDAMIILGAFNIGHESQRLLQERIKALPLDPTLSDLLVDLWRRDGWDTREEPTDKLTVSTIHGAKGSEWDVVFIPAMEQGVFPSKQSLSEEAANQTCAGVSCDEFEEERRLCFVAVTRARHRIYLTWAKKRTAFFKTTDQEPSQFFSEMGIKQEVAA